MLRCIFAIAALLFNFNAAIAIMPGSIPISPSSGGAQIAITEARHTRKFLYVGGDYNHTTSGTILQNQVYVEQLTPAGGISQKLPIVLLHGGDLSGDLWLNKPDAGRGWASFWLDRGYQVYIVDEWSVGRSAAAAATTRGAGGTLEGAEEAFTAPELYNKYYQARFHFQWPGVGDIYYNSGSLPRRQDIDTDRRTYTERHSWRSRVRRFLLWIRSHHDWR